jgi:hypothetical protein
MWISAYLFFLSAGFLPFGAFSFWSRYAKPSLALSSFFLGRREENPELGNQSIRIHPAVNGLNHQLDLVGVMRIIGIDHLDQQPGEDVVDLIERLPRKRQVQSSAGSLKGCPGGLITGAKKAAPLLRPFYAAAKLLLMDIDFKGGVHIHQVDLGNDFTWSRITLPAQIGLLN